MRLDNHYQAFADPRAAGQVAGIQTGIDVWRGSLIPGHSDTVGLYLAYGNVDGLVTNPAATAYILQHTGSLNLNAYSVGLPLWSRRFVHRCGVAGLVLRRRCDNAIYPPADNGTGFTSSLEAVYPIPLPWFGPRFVLEPEARSSGSGLFR